MSCELHHSPLQQRSLVYHPKQLHQQLSLSLLESILLVACLFFFSCGKTSLKQIIINYKYCYKKVRPIENNNQQNSICKFQPVSFMPEVMGANPGGATGAIAPPRICHEGLNITYAPPENDEIASLLLNSPPLLQKVICTPA